ncbi:MAG: peptide-binding protein, partial [Zetaproteobacteria bacterium]
MNADATNLIPMVATDAPSHAIAGWLYRPLLKYDKDLNLTGDLARAWHVEDGGRTIRFFLRRNARWTDGVPFSSADCAFTLALIRDPKTQSPYASDFALISGWETPDPYTFVVRYREPFAPALSSWAGLAILPEHVFAGEDIMHTKLARAPKATIGPYRLAGWRPQQEIRLIANPDYYDGPVWIAERRVRIIPDAATQFLELLA